MSRSGRTPATAGWNGLVVVQTLTILAAWLAGALPHLGNDGLWYVGDAGRHALNGMFWWDLLSTFPRDLKEYVLRYYARYPAIAPVSYPPAFYLLEAVAFRVFGPSPFVAKWLVLCCSLAAGLCLAAWLRRYVCAEAGWGGALLVLQPGVVVWSNAVMLNIPAMAVGMAALYVTRRWLEHPAMPRLLLAIVLAGLTALTYFPAALVTVVACAWLATDDSWRTILRRHPFAVWLVAAALVLVILAIVAWVPLPFDLALSRLEQLRDWDKWTFYARAFPRLLRGSILVLAGLAVPMAIVESRWRSDVRLLLLWILITYLGLTYFWSRHQRYLLLAAPACVLLAMITLRAALDVAQERWSLNLNRWLSPLLIALVAFHAWALGDVSVPSIDGFREVALAVEREAPTERVLYEGAYDGVFIFYVRAYDPQFRRGVVRGSKLLYASAIMPTWRLREHVSSAADVVAALQTECGCGWVVLERTDTPDEIQAVRFLREAVRGPAFELVRSFPVHAEAATAVDIYRFTGRIDVPAELNLPFPVLGQDTSFRARPIER